MRIEEFKLERLLSVWQNVVDYNFTDTGVHSLYLHELITREELEELYESVQLCSIPGECRKRRRSSSKR